MFEYTIENVLKDRIDFLRIYPSDKNIEDNISEIKQAISILEKAGEGK